VAARAARHGPELTATYRKGNRRLSYRRVERNAACLHLRATSLDLRRLPVLGLAHDGAWLLTSS
jgi:hypothetical protein